MCPCGLVRGGSSSSVDHRIAGARGLGTIPKARDSTGLFSLPIDCVPFFSPRCVVPKKIVCTVVPPYSSQLVCTCDVHMYDRLRYLLLVCTDASKENTCQQNSVENGKSDAAAAVAVGAALLWHRGYICLFNSSMYVGMFSSYK